MLAGVAGLLLIGSSVGVRLEEQLNLAPQTAEALIGALSTAVGQQLAASVVRFSADPEAERGLELELDALVRLRAFAGPRRIRVELTGVRRGSPDRHLTLELPIADYTWRDALVLAVRDLFPEGIAPRAVVPLDAGPPRAPPEEASVSALPWILLASGAVAVGAGVAFRWVGAGDREALAEGALTHQEELDHLSAMRATGAASRVFAGSGVASIVLGLALLFAE
ncbi:MAG: hypothetical protein IT384_10005 [Deltaproteobacteria bacterium]|nr:hypothetical protein [Deltaproteobacteria bacterium]